MTACGPLSAPPSSYPKPLGDAYARCFDYTPPKTAVRQRQLIEALQCGPVTTRDLNLLYNNMSATIKALEKRGVVVVEERRAGVAAASRPRVLGKRQGAGRAHERPAAGARAD